MNKKGISNGKLWISMKILGISIDMERISVDIVRNIVRKRFDMLKIRKDIVTNTWLLVILDSVEVE